MALSGQPPWAPTGCCSNVPSPDSGVLLECACFPPEELATLAGHRTCGSSGKNACAHARLVHHAPFLPRVAWRGGGCGGSERAPRERRLRSPPPQPPPPPPSIPPFPTASGAPLPKVGELIDFLPPPRPRERPPLDPGLRGWGHLGGGGLIGCSEPSAAGCPAMPTPAKALSLRGGGSGVWGGEGESKPGGRRPHFKRRPPSRQLPSPCSSHPTPLPAR